MFGTDDAREVYELERRRGAAGATVQRALDALASCDREAAPYRAVEMGVAIERDRTREMSAARFFAIVERAW
jgi:hypothetical protein